MQLVQGQRAGDSAVPAAVTRTPRSRGGNRFLQRIPETRSQAGLRWERRRRGPRCPCQGREGREGTGTRLWAAVERAGGHFLHTEVQHAVPADPPVLRAHDPGHISRCRRRQLPPDAAVPGATRAAPLPSRWRPVREHVAASPRVASPASVSCPRLVSVRATRRSTEGARRDVYPKVIWHGQQPQLRVTLLPRRGFSLPRGCRGREPSLEAGEEAQAWAGR